MQKPEISFKKLDDDTISDAYQLFIKTFGKKLSLTNFEKKYDTRFSGVHHICYLAYAKNEPVGFYGCLPALFYLDGKSFLCAQACDSITVKEYQGQGIHFELANRTYEELKKNNIHFVFAMHSENTYQSTKKLNWVLGKKMVRFHINTSGFPISKIVAKIKPLLSSYHQIFLNTIDQYTIDRNLFTNPLNKEQGISYFYNDAYMQYKTFSKNYVLKISNTTFWLCLKSKIEIGAIEFVSKEDLLFAIDKLSLILKKIGVPEIIIHTTENTLLDKILSEVFIKLPSWNIGYKDLGSGLPLETMMFNPSDLDTF